MEIEDTPRYSWRGAHLDVGRHFYPVEFLKRYVDLLALHKLNILHWHLTEDQGWRMEVPAHPKLTQVGAWRTATDTGQRYGGFYSLRDMREIVRYAAERCVTIVPEIEMPGHAQAALAAYPQLSCTGGPFQVWSEWGVSKEVFCAGSEEVFAVLEDVLAQAMEVFPGRFLHIGGKPAGRRYYLG